MPPHNIQNRNSLKLTEMEEEGLRANLSHQELIPGMAPSVTVVTPADTRGGDDVADPSSCELSTPPRGTSVSKKQLMVVIILFYVNLINYMDRFTVAGILYDIQICFGLSDTQSGLLQTAFVLVYMVMAPLFGYLGDRYSRKNLMAVGIFFWSLATLLGSFMPNYALFLLFRCLVGVGEASYSTIAPTIISDLFVSDTRSKMLAVFYFAIPVGSGLGYIIGAEVTELARVGETDWEAWRWGLRVTPVMGLLALALILFLVHDPPRGSSEGGQHLQATSFLSDLRYLFLNKSFVLSTLAFTCVTFVAGALAFWGPIFTKLGVMVQDHPNAKADDVSFVFGAIAMSAGLLGVPLGSFAGQKLRVKLPYADPLVCGLGLLFSVPLILGAMVLAEWNTIGSYIVVFFGQVFLNLNWAVVSDIVLYIVIPTRRSSAEAFQILFSHALGDAGSPSLIGVVADAFKPYIKVNGSTSYLAPEDYDIANFTSSDLTTLDTFNTTTTTPAPDLNNDYIEFKSKQYALFLCCIVNIFGAVFFFWNSCYIAEDKARCDRIIAGAAPEREPSTTESTASSNSSRSLASPGDSPEEEEESEDKAQIQSLLT
ncbi:protein spinster-like [Portunus trituberculatus]|uniref:protein spinster-like n=1 Tax=Portunus trituberculatus TaxID=210409 RepID=UPI001E1CEBC0|nr:protein spinster-like [Portunus trituberculatus]XP_045106252.1 protein spinster-like [Portunus trituberculatus]XP_045106253.1 protein spinster-like [Portunus trituberculatus]